MQLIHIILGGGASGVFSAIQCKQASPLSRVILIEKTNQLLSKVRISGGGRCNVTHACFEPNHLIKNYPRGSKELLGPFHSFQPSDTVAWFTKRGVSLKAEEDGRMFPVTNSSETIIDCLTRELETSGVEVWKGQKIESVHISKGKFLVHLKNQSIESDTLLVATGSSPFGHTLAHEMGHTIVQPVPSLFTFNVPSSPLLDLAGISAPNVLLELEGLGFHQQGALLLTHWGFSGPAALKLSAWSARELHRLNYQATLKINWLPMLNCEELYQSFLRSKQECPSQTLPNLLPSNLFDRLVSSLGINPSTPAGKIPHRSLRALSEKLHGDRYTIDGKTTYKHEFVTAGGVALKEINFKTMESKLIPGLYFAGEILDVDGITGGFNFQNAWTTGWLAAKAMTSKKTTDASKTSPAVMPL